MKSLASLVAVLAGDQDLVDILVVEIADGALDEAAFLIDERRRGRFQRELADRSPTAAADIRSRA